VADSRLTGTLHLVRHGEVANPRGVIYGRLPGYNLSERGQCQAEVAAERLARKEIGAVWASPLERAQETARTIAARHDLHVTTDDRLLESGSTLQGISRNVVGVLLSPKRWWSLRNPMRPSWGESFADIRTRMLDAIEQALGDAHGREAVIVSHQTPVLVARLALVGRRIPPWLGRLPCETGSITTMVLETGRTVSASYFVSDY
jgi:broad specificity phosphatase PhoE